MDHLESIVGKKVIIKMKRNDYNIRYPHSSISGTQCLMCENLLEQFDVADDDDSNDAGLQKALKKNKVVLIFDNEISTRIL